MTPLLDRIRQLRAVGAIRPQLEAEAVADVVFRGWVNKRYLCGLTLSDGVDSQDAKRAAELIATENLHCTVEEACQALVYLCEARAGQGMA